MAHQALFATVQLLHNAAHYTCYCSIVHFYQHWCANMNSITTVVLGAICYYLLGLLLSLFSAVGIKEIKNTCR